MFGPRRDPSSPHNRASSRSSRRRCSKAACRRFYGDGGQTRDFTYVANVVDGVLRACEAPGVAGEVINVATAGRISLNHLLQTINEDRRLEHHAELRETRAGDVRDSQADISEGRSPLGQCCLQPSKKACVARWSGAARRTRCRPRSRRFRLADAQRPRASWPAIQPGMRQMPAEHAGICVFRVSAAHRAHTRSDKPLCVVGDLEHTDGRAPGSLDGPAPPRVDDDRGRATGISAVSRAAT